MTDTDKLAQAMADALAEAEDVLDAAYQELQTARLSKGLSGYSAAIERAIMLCSLARGNWQSHKHALQHGKGKE